MSAIILDTETTGAHEPDVIELAYVDVQLREGRITTGVPWVGRFQPTKPITLGAMAAHHIIPEDLYDCPLWPGVWPLYEGTQYLIGHQIDFDWAAIGKPEVKRICTLALARKAWPGLDSHTLGALTYHLHSHPEAREMLQRAHAADQDVALCAIVLNELTNELQPRDWGHLWELSEIARLPTHFTFGKYGPKDGAKLGTPIAEVKRSDPGYIRWCLSSCDIVRDDVYWQRALGA